MGEEIELLVIGYKINEFLDAPGRPHRQGRYNKNSSGEHSAANEATEGSQARRNASCT